MTPLRHFFLLGTAALATLLAVRAAPTVYDQRQDGDYNVHAQLENFLLLVAIPSNSNELLSDLALQALEFKQRFASRSGTSPSKNSLSSALRRSIEDTRDGETIPALVVRLEEGGSKEKAETPIASDARTAQPIAVIVEADEGRRAKSLSDFEVVKGAYFVDGRKIAATKTESGRARNVVDAERSRITARENEWSRGKGAEGKDFASSSSSNARDNNTAAVDEKQTELKLVGDGIENCGPGRHRDKSGVCQADESTGAS